MTVHAPDPERDDVVIRREHLGTLYAAGLAVLPFLTRDHPSSERTFALARAVSAAEEALMGADNQTPAPRTGDGRRS